MRTDRIRGHLLVPGLLRSGETCIDCGAHQGEFSRWAAQNAGLRVFAFEADDSLFADLPRIANVEFIHAAVGSSEGEVDFYTTGDRDGSITYYKDSGNATRVRQISLGRFLEDKGIKELELLKIDIEGAEIPVIDSLSDKELATVRQITVEFHDFLRMDDLVDIKRIMTRFRQLGFVVIKASVFTYGDILLLNQSLLKLGWLDRISIRMNGAWIPSFNRGVRRLLNNRLFRR